MELTKKNIEEVFKAHNNPHSALQAFGRLIVEEFKSIKLIGEIERPDGEDSYESLRESLKIAFWEFPRVGLSINETDRNSRAALSLFFVWAGIMHYGEEQGHEFWPHLFSELGIERSPTLSLSCGELFLKCLRENSLETFPTLKEGHVYLSRILLHGLVPERHIDRFMNDLILERLNQPHGMYETGPSIVENWKEGTSCNFPRPIARFLDHGHPVNIDLVERILHMAKRWDEDDPTYWWQWGVPKYMVDSFRRCEAKKRVPISHRSRRIRAGSNPNVSFDPTRDNEPVLVVPSQNLEGCTSAELWFQPLASHSDEVREQVKLDLIHRSGDNESISLPMNIPIGPSTSWNLRLANRSYQIDYAFPESGSGTKAPIYIIGPSGKLISLGMTEMLPEEIGVIYPADASLIIEGASPVCEPISLTGSWREWNHCYFSLGEKGTIKYEGPNHSLDGDVNADISFERYDYSEVAPNLLSQDFSPSWFRSSDHAKIVFNPGGLQILFSDQSHSLWRRAIGRLRRLDVPLDRAHSRPFRFSSARETDVGWAVDIPEIETITPGAYELRLQGALGVEDFVLPFIYLPIRSSLRNFARPGDVIANDFSIELSEEFQFEAIENTAISSLPFGRTINVSLKEECADAYCALRVFKDTARPTILLLERSDFRWVRHSESGPIGWRVWRAAPEIIPIQRLEEIYDSRAILELPWPDGDRIENRMPALKPKIILLGKRSDEDRDILIMSYEASRFLPRNRNIWLIELGKFADHFKDLADYRAADIVLDHSHIAAEQIPLFSFLRFPEYKGFALKHEDSEDGKERLTLEWLPQENEPQKNRFIRMFPVGRPADIVRIPLENDKKPPLDVCFKPLEIVETWSSQIEFIQGRFIVSQESKDPGTPKAIWTRCPAGWSDWLEMPDLMPDQYPNHFLQMEYAKDAPDLGRFPLSGFLASFYLDWDKEPGRQLKSLLGDGIVGLAIPFAPGHIWEVKTVNGIKVSLKVAPHEILGELGPVPPISRVPANWGELQSGCRVRFEVQEDHPYIGDKGTSWMLSRDPANIKPLMSSKWGGNLDINYWIKDAIDDEEAGVFIPHLPLNDIWDNSPHLPLLDHVPVQDHISIPGVHNGIVPQELSPETEKAIELINRWTAWIQSYDINPLLKRILQGRLDGDQAGLISAICAWIARLQAHRFEKAIAKPRNPNENPLFQARKLHEESLEFVKTFLRKSFLRDLILSELIIGWYWNRKFHS